VMVYYNVMTGNVDLVTTIYDI